ncbi:MAG: VWA domain-containing protein [Bacteroidota bacterium]
MNPSPAYGRQLMTLLAIFGLLALFSCQSRKQTGAYATDAIPPPPPSIEMEAPTSMSAPPEAMMMKKEAVARSKAKRKQDISEEMDADGFVDNYDDEEKADKFNREQYDRIYENPIISPKAQPLSTFSIDVDVASYANTRRFLNDNRLPYPDAVRIEEMINYFNYDYAAPTGEHPFAIHTEVAACPWQPEHQLVHIGLQGKEVLRENLPPSNLVFLFDVSGSMDSPDKLPLLKAAFRLLVNQLDEDDRVAMVVYAGAAGVVLPSTLASKKSTILEALHKLNAGGSTAGGAGIELAYQIAMDNFVQGGNNRVILATDGDFNVGPSSDGELVRMIEEKRENDIFLSVLGFGSGNLQDSKMEKLADKGNGNYAYIDNILEAKKVLVNEMGSTLLAIAKDVKIQVEFNPALVKGYRLVGYENRLMAAEDFDDDTKDAGELGAGHTVTALYEIVPVGASTEVRTTGDLKYQLTVPTDGSQRELMYVKFRYKQPTGTVSTLLEQPIGISTQSWSRSSENFRWSAAVAGFGMLLRRSAYKGNADYAQVKSWATQAKGADLNGYRAEFIQLVEKAMLLDTEEANVKD